MSYVSSGGGSSAVSKFRTRVTGGRTTMNTNYNAPARRLAAFRTGLYMAVAAQLFTPTAAAPSSGTGDGILARRQSRDGESGGDGMNYQIWMPIVVILIFLVVTVVAFFYRKNIAQRLSGRQTTASTTANAQGTRELTAEQLAGSIATGGNATTTPATRTRRTRRPRRTPSQISTTSLPAYAKEPGEQEVVIFRGPEDMEDASMPTTVMMEALPEDGEDSLHSADSDRYTPMPHTPLDTPLLQHEDEPLELLEDNGVPRPSGETLSSGEETTALMRRSSITRRTDDDPRGAAPGYYEVVDLSPNPDSPPARNDSRPSGASPPASPPPEEAAPRRSGFRTILNSLPNRMSIASASHTRAASSLSMVDSDDSHQTSSHIRGTSQSRPSHRTTPSGSSSIFNNPFRTLSRQKSFNNGNLTSPSLISLNSISAPLAHTLTRTEFTYPKSGPTPEQIKLISSRDAFARFGVPYGRDAIAFASTSRQDVSMPPPGFDEVPASPASSSTPAGSSRLRSASSATQLREEITEDSSSTTNEPFTPDAEAAERTMTTEAPPLSAVLEAPLKSPWDSHLDAHDGSEEPSFPAQKPETIPLPPSPKSSIRQSPPPEVEPIETEPISMPKQHVVPITTTAAPPPSSFKLPQLYDRPESRASSIQTFATAAESMGHLGYPSDEDEYEEAEANTPTRPKLEAGHVLEASDATVTLGSGLR